MESTDSDLTPHEAEALELFNAFVLRIEQGESLDFEQYCSQHAAHAILLTRWWEDWRNGCAALGQLGLAAPDFMRKLPADPRGPEYFGESSTIEAATRRLLERAQNHRRYSERLVLAAGGMGTVYRVFDRDLRRQLAMKVLRTEAGADGRPLSERSSLQRVGRFLEEAQVTAQLDHPGIVPVHELGLGADGSFYFTMKMVRGQELADVIELSRAERDGWNRMRVVGVLLKVCEAMAYAHAKGVLHRDLKPSNIMVGRFGEVYVMDWGLARVLGREDTHNLRLREEAMQRTVQVESERSLAKEGVDSPLYTMDGDVVGTPNYMSPEQAAADNAQIGPRSDIYSVGAVLYQLLSGCIPYFEAGVRIAPRAVLMRLLQGPPAELASLDPKCPAELVSICERAMARDPEQRYSSMQALADDLRAWLEGRVVAAHESGRWAVWRKWIRRNPLLAGLAALVAISVPVATVFAVHSWLARGALAAAAQLAQQARLEQLLETGYYELGSGQVAMALASFGAARAMAPGQEEVLAGILLAHVAGGHPEAALAELEVEGRRGLSSSWSESIRAYALRTLGRTQEAQEVAAQSPPPSRALDHYLMGFILGRQAEQVDKALLPKAIEHLERALLLAPKPRALYYYDWARTLAQLEDPQSTQKLVEVLQARWPDAPQSLLYCGVALALIKDGEAALAFAERLLALDSWQDRGNYAKALALKALADREGARKAIQSALEQRPDDPLYLCTLAALELSLEDPSAALEASQRALRADATSLAARRAQTAALFKLKRLEEARTSAESLIQLGSLMPRDWMELGSIRDDLKDYAGAIAAYARALELAPDTARAYFGLGSAYAAKGECQPAIQALERAVALDPSDARSHNNLAIALRRYGELERALEHYQQALRLDPTNYKAHNNFANALAELGQHAQACTHYAEALRLRPQYVHALGGLGVARLRLAEFQTALPLLERAIALGGAELDPSFASELERARLYVSWQGLAEELRRGLPPNLPAEQWAEYVRFALLLGYRAEALTWLDKVLATPQELPAMEIEDLRVLGARAALAETTGPLLLENRARARRWLQAYVDQLTATQDSSLATKDSLRRALRGLLRSPELRWLAERDLMLPGASQAELASWQLLADHVQELLKL